MKLLSKICRICLKSYEKEEELISVFENDEQNIKVAKKIYDISGIFIEKNCSTPEKICRLCIQTLNISYRFRQLCLQSDIKLKTSECNDNLYVKNILGNSETNFVEKQILKIEPDSEILQSDVESNSNDYLDYENIRKYDDQHTGDNFMLQNSSNEDVVSVLKGNKSRDIQLTANKADKYNEIEFDESYEYLDESLIAAFKKPRKNNAKIKNRNGMPLCTFKMEWIKKYDFLQLDEDNKSAVCTFCNCQLKIIHKGESTIKRHLKTSKHIANTGHKIIQKNRNSLSKEENIHICDICGNKYTTLHLLKRHMKYHSDVMDYECEICQKKFRQMMQLKRHMRIHTGEKPYSCKFCNKAIRDYSTKIRHERMHTGERPYVCPTCNKGFQYPFVLKNHLKIHTGEKLYECVVCNKNFTLKKHLTSHLETMLHKSRAQKFEEQSRLTNEDKPN